MGEPNIKLNQFFLLLNRVPAHSAVVRSEDGASVGLAEELDVLEAEQEAVGGRPRQDQRLRRRLRLLLRKIFITFHSSIIYDATG